MRNRLYMTCMTSYENAASTKLVATNCVVCNRPLVDAKSVELGIGPDCRKKYGFDMECTEEVRKYANRLVHQLATGHLSASNIKDALDGLRNNGFVKLAEKIAARLISIVVLEENNVLTVYLPYDPRAISPLRMLGRPVYEEGKFKCWIIAANFRNQLYVMMKRYYGGLLGTGPKGLFRVGV